MTISRGCIIRQKFTESRYLLRKNELKDSYIRPIVYRGYGTILPDGSDATVEASIIAFDLGKFLGDKGMNEGIDAMVSSWRKFAPDTIPSIAKADGNYLNSQLALMEAHRYGFNEAILLDNFGFVSEGSGENIFVVKNGVLFTPSVSSSILEGITRDSVIQIAKDAGFDIADRIEVYYEAGLRLCEVFITHGDYIASETLSISIRKAELPKETYVVDYKIDGESLRIGLIRKNHT